MIQAIDLPSWLQLPTWLVTITLVGLGAIKGAFWIRSAKFSNGSGPHPLPTEVIAAAIETRTVLKSIADQLGIVVTVQNDTALVLARVAERLGHLPTEAQLMEGLRQNRHAAAEAVDRSTHAIRDEIQEARFDVGTNAAQLREGLAELKRRMGGSP